MIWMVVSIAAPRIAGAESGNEPLRFGWIDWDPYQYEEVRNRERIVSGLDVELVRAIASGADQTLEFEHRTWAGVLAGLADGTIDVSVGYRRPERDALVHYSFPYRLETEVILVRRGEAAPWSAGRPHESSRCDARTFSHRCGPGLCLRPGSLRCLSRGSRQCAPRDSFGERSGIARAPARGRGRRGRDGPHRRRHDRLAQRLAATRSRSCPS